MENINWREWGREAFDEAEKEDKLVLLSISAVWCHWCHVMDQTSYSDREVANLINEKFVPVRVDNDKRPDINDRYNMGGWPTTAFLTPRGDLIAGWTYIPPNRMKSLLKEISEAYRFNKVNIYAEILRRSKLEASEGARLSPDGSALDGSIIDTVAQAIIRSYDSRFGGFGSEPKFPHIDALSLALHQCYRTSSAQWKEIAVKTLDSMGWGGLYDEEEGGFFRYSTTADWSIPHFEKMAEDNASFISLYLEAGQISGQDKYITRALHAASYMEKTLFDGEAGGFYGSQDADEEYYKRTLQERLSLKAPTVDHTKYTNWNGLAISSFVGAYFVTGDERFLKRALEAANFLRDKLWDEQVGMWHYFDDGPKVSGLLCDQIYAADGFLSIYQAAGEYSYLSMARRLIDLIIDKFFDEKSGGLFDRIDEGGAIGYLKKSQKPIAVNAKAASTMSDLYSLTSERYYRDKAEQILKAFLPAYKAYGIFAASYAVAVEKYLYPQLVLTVVNDGDPDFAKSLSRAAQAYFGLNKLVQTLDPNSDSELMNEKGFHITTCPAIYPCIGERCLAPVTDPSKLAAALKIVV